jgi:hypothetical protein
MKGRFWKILETMFEVLMQKFNGFAYMYKLFRLFFHYGERERL